MAGFFPFSPPPPPASSTVSPSLEMTLLTVFFLGSLHGPECAEVARQRPRGGRSPAPSRRSSPRAFSPRSAQRSARGSHRPWGACPEGCGVNGRETQPLLVRVLPVPNVRAPGRAGRLLLRGVNGLSHAERGVNTDRSALPGGTEVKSQLQRGKRLPRAGLTSVSCGVFSETSPKAYSKGEQSHCLKHSQSIKCDRQ